LPQPAGQAPVARPIVGITAFLTEASFGVWELASTLVPYDYVRAVESAGGRPLLVPPSREGIPETLAVLDGLVFSGGSDLDPAHYGQPVDPETTGIAPERDDAELELLRAALERDLPVLAICRGSQVLNVARGGDLVQHLPALVGHHGHKQTPGTFSRHAVRVEAGTRLAGLIGERALVQSHHHQGFGRLGEGLRAAARDEEGTLEALEDPSRRFALGVLWHPEAGEDKRLF
jgi:putative glutamine amidotransferase